MRRASLCFLQQKFGGAEKWMKVPLPVGSMCCYQEDLGRFRANSSFVTLTALPANTAAAVHSV